MGLLGCRLGVKYDCLTGVAGRRCDRTQCDLELNFARNQRARATSQLQMINAVVTVIISSAIGPLLDTYPDSLAWIYWSGALFGGLGLALFAQVRVVGEARQRVRERQQRRSPTRSMGFVQILKTDRWFRWYQINMFGAGFSNMLIEAPLIFIITRQMQASYTVSIMLTMVIPFAVSLISMPLWANYLDRVHVAQFVPDRAYCGFWHNCSPCSVPCLNP